MQGKITGLMSFPLNPNTLVILKISFISYNMHDPWVILLYLRQQIHVSESQSDKQI